jgi:transposase InsO family protein
MKAPPPSACCAEDESAAAIGVLRRAVGWFAARGVTVARVLSDNGSAYRSHAWRDACAEMAITRANPSLPPADQRQNRIERFQPHHGLRAGPSHGYFPASRHAARPLPAWLHEYNRPRPHTALGGRPRITRLTKLPEQYS